MRISIGTMAVVALAVTCVARPAPGQQIQQVPLAPPAPQAPLASPAPAGPPAPPAASPEPRAPQLAQSPPSHLTTQDCVQLADPVAQTDCLNQVAADGDYLPTHPAPGSNMPMEYRLPLGKREIPPRP